MGAVVTNDDKYAGKVLRQIRVAKGFTQEKLAEKIYLSFQQLQKYEKGKSKMSIGMVSRIAKALEVDPSLFFSFSVNSEENLKSETEVMSLYSKLNKKQKRVFKALLKLMIATLGADSDQ